jgi:hypothetical protein
MREARDDPYGGEELEVRIRIVLLRGADVLDVNLRADKQIESQGGQQEAIEKFALHTFVDGRKVRSRAGNGKKAEEPV